MQEQHLFEYAVIRVVPRVEREEFLNVGVVLYCAKQKYLQVRYAANDVRMTACFGEMDIAEVCTYLQAFSRICAGDKDSGPIARLPIAERFRWLTATRSTVVQTSKVHSGFSADLDKTLEKLFAEMVL
ncbi:MAG: hypothetical protein JWQ38_943 [Flavipsychrobacter sp.]|nr:hypothetical protein [Flavipsychrobacter sp.]